MRGAPSDPRGGAVVKDYARVAITQILHNNPRDMHVPLVIDCQKLRVDRSCDAIRRRAKWLPSSYCGF